MTVAKFGMRLKRLRTAHGMTQVDLAKRANVTQGFIAQLEGGLKKDPSLATLRRLARALKVPMEKLLEDSIGGKETAMASYDVYPYAANKKWHYLIFKLFDGSTGASSVAHDSQAYNRHGYLTREEAQQAGLAHKSTMP